MKDKWMYNLDGGEIWQGEEFDTKEEAIKFGKEEADDNFRVGQIKEVPVSGIDVDFILENVAENTTNDIGEVGEDYLCDVANIHSSELEEKLNVVLFAWIKKYKYEPNFFQINNEETIEV